MQMSFTKEDMTHMREWLYDYINDHCIERVGPDDNLLQGKLPNTYYSWQFYLRRGLFNSEFLTFSGLLFWEMFAQKYNEKPFQIAGLETAATPLIVGITMTARMLDVRVNSFSIRKERKEYGLRNRFEGTPNEDPVLLVDDMCNSKNSLLLAKQYVEEEGLSLYNQAFVLVNKNVHGEDDTDKYIGDQMKVRSLFNATEFPLSYQLYHAKKSIL